MDEPDQNARSHGRVQNAAGAIGQALGESGGQPGHEHDQ